MKTNLIRFGEHRPSIPLSLAGYVGALLLVTVSTLVGLLVASRWGSAPVVLLYLLPVLAAAIYAGLRPGLVAAIASALAFNYYFTAPYRTFAIDRPADIVTVVVLFLVAVVSSQLAASVRKQAQIAAAHASRNATIAGFSRELLGTHDKQAVCQLTVREIAGLFDCMVVLLTSGDPSGLAASEPGSAMLSPSDYAAAALALETGEVTGRGKRRVYQADWQFHPIASEVGAIAALGLAKEDGIIPVSDSQVQLLGSLLDQAALALERVRLESAARDAAAISMQDRLRTALLASIGEDVKPRLNAITASARAMKRQGIYDKAMASSIAEEAAKLERYIENLVDLNPGGEHEPLEFGNMKIDLHRRSVLRDGNEVHLTPKEYAVLAELAKHGGRVLSHAQLLRTVWGPAQQDHIDYLRVAISALRQKLEADPAHPKLILNEPSVGYRLAMS